MKIEQNIRIASLIASQLNGTIGEKQEEELLLWISESEENQRLYDELCDKETLPNRLSEHSNYSTENIKQKVIPYIYQNKSRKRFIKIYYGMAAAILLPVIVISLLWIKSDEMEKTYPIVPGKEYAVLTLNDGKEIQLKTIESFIDLSENRTTVSNDTNGLSYTSSGVTYEVPEYHTLKVPLGGFYPVKLADGTKVWLNADSELKYPVEFVGDERAVFLKGEAFFDVEKGDIPFIVYLEHSKVEVLGTSFNINAYSSENSIYTTLVTGSIAFYSSQTEERTVIEPGQQITMNVSSGEVEVHEVDVEVYTSWKDGIFYFKGMTLEEIMKIVSRWYQIDVVFKSEKIKGDRYNGKMPMYSDLDNILRKIQMSGDINYYLNGRELLIYENKNGIR